jgi:protein-S-isoprenylcysteine O-methyltransferase Ste14
MTGRIVLFVYGLLCYAIFFGTFLYAIGFIGGFAVPATIDGEPRLPLGQALAVDLALLALFATQHSVMARPVFKRWWTRFVPQDAERSTYVLLASLCLIVLFAFWQPLGGTVWDVGNPAGRSALYALFAMGWAIVLLSTFLIDHFDLFGLRQVWLALRGIRYTPPAFRTPLFYRWVRHPLYVGFIFAFWATPHMTVTHLVFAVATTAYILLAVRLEERDLLAAHPEYADYRKRVPMLLPLRLAPRSVARAEPGRQ